VAGDSRWLRVVDPVEREQRGCKIVAAGVRESAINGLPEQALFERPPPPRFMRGVL
jgi:hypothetical protein